MDQQVMIYKHLSFWSKHGEYPHYSCTPMWGLAGLVGRRLVDTPAASAGSRSGISPLHGITEQAASLTESRDVQAEVER